MAEGMERTGVNQGARSIISFQQFQPTDISSLETKIKSNKLISGHSHLKDHMHKIKLAENRCCSCSEARQTVKRIIMDCPTLSVQRQIMKENIDEAYSEHQGG